MPDSPFAGFQRSDDTPPQGPSSAEDMRPQILVVLAETSKYLRSRGNDPAMVAMVTTLLGQLELTMQSLARAGIDVPLLIHVPQE